MTFGLLRYKHAPGNKLINDLILNITCLKVGQIQPLSSREIVTSRTIFSKCIFLTFLQQYLHFSSSETQNVHVWYGTILNPKKTSQNVSLIVSLFIQLNKISNIPSEKNLHVNIINQCFPYHYFDGWTAPSSAPPPSPHQDDGRLLCSANH